MTQKNKHFRHPKLSEAKFRQIVRYFFRPEQLRPQPQAGQLSTAAAISAAMTAISGKAASSHSPIGSCRRPVRAHHYIRMDYNTPDGTFIRDHAHVYDMVREGLHNLRRSAS